MMLPEIVPKSYHNVKQCCIITGMANRKNSKKDNDFVHEYYNFLQVIGGYAQMADSTDDTVFFREAIRDIKTMADNLARIIDPLQKTGQKNHRPRVAEKSKFCMKK